MKVQFNVVIGETEFLMSEEVESETEFFQKLHFYQNLPKTGPNGETDLKLSYRTPKGYTYYSIVSEKAGMEFKFGQHQGSDTLFPKQWEPLYSGEVEAGDVATHSSKVTPVAVPTPAPVKRAPTKVKTETNAPEAVPAAVVQSGNDLLAKFLNK